METLLDLLARAENLDQLNDEELATLLSDLEAAGLAVAEGTLGDAELEQLEQAGVTAEAIRSEQTSRTEDASTRAERAAAALDRICGQEGDGEGEGEPDEGDGPAEGEGEGTPAEGEPDADAEGEPEGEAAEPTAEQLAAAARPARPAAALRLGRTNARRPAQAAPRATPAPSRLSLVAAANAPGTPAGAPITSFEQLARAFYEGFQATAGYRHGPPVKVPIARAVAEYPAEFVLDGDMSGNMRKIGRAQAEVRRQRGLTPAITAAAGDGGPDSLPASGGICAPRQVRYDMPVIGTDARPFRDQALVRFGADRGGVRTLPIPVITDVAAGVDVWTNENDISPSDPVTKPCLEVTCPEEDETFVEAITKCLQAGNFRLRYLAEQIEAWMELLNVWHARTADNRLISAVAAGSKDVTAETVLGTTRDVLAVLDRLVTGFNNFHRAEVPFTWAAPAWLRANIRTDIARQMPVGTLDETLALADAQIARWLAVRNIEPVWFLDGEAGQVFANQADGQPVRPWPTNVVSYAYPSGSWLFLDGGALDLGLIRDSVLTDTNDARMFAETMEGAHFHGIDSFRLDLDICPNGAAASLIDIDPCATGS